MSVSPMNGDSPDSKTYEITPIAHISVKYDIESKFTISGAIYDKMQTIYY